MASIFAITAASSFLNVKSGGKPGSVSFTVTNTSNKPLDAEISIKPLGKTQGAWLSTDGEAIRTFQPNKAQDVNVTVKMPANAMDGDFNFRIDVAAVENKDEDFTEGPEVTLKVTKEVQQKKPFPVWILFVIGGVLILGAAITTILILTNKTTVPGVVGLAYLDAKAQLDGKKLGLTLAAGKLHPDTNAWTVQTQVPDSGSKVKPNSVITLTITPPVNVPDLIGMPLGQAKQTLAANQLSDTLVTGGAGVENTWVVKAQSPAANAPVMPNSKIALTVAQSKVAVPDVIGKTYAEAMQILAAQTLKGVSASGSSTDWSIVQNQIPAAQAMAEVQSQVVLSLISGDVNVPSVLGLPYAKAAEVLTANKLMAQKFGAEASLKYPLGYVSSQIPVPNTKVRPGYVVRLDTVAPSVAVPKVAGLALVAAVVQMTQANLLPQVFGDQRNVFMQVSSTNPAAGTAVLKNSKVNIYMPGAPVIIKDEIFRAALPVTTVETIKRIEVQNLRMMAPK